MSDIFKRIAEEEVKTLYKNQRIFAEDYAPQTLDEVVNREKQKDEIARCIHTTTNGVRSELYVFGVTGVGKTYTVKAVLNDVPKEWVKKFQHVWVNCKTIRPISDFQVLNEISTQLGKSWKKGYATKDIEDWVIRKHNTTPLLIVFDEVDVLAQASDRLLYSFFDKGVSQILLSNVFRWVEDADMRIKSRSQNNSIIFGTYSNNEMRDILQLIAEKGLKEGVMSEKILEKIAEYTNDKFLGDVRKAKYLMSNSVMQAMKEGVSKVNEAHLVKAIPSVEPMSLKDILKNFSLSEQVALAGFVTQRINVSDSKHDKRKPATTENVHFFYVKCAELNGLEPVGEAMMKNYLQRLEISGILKHEQKSHKTRGRTNVYVSPYYSIENLGIALKELKIKVYGTGLLNADEFFEGSK